MINVIIKKNNLKKIESIFVSGHAEYAKFGNDIVCAGVSSIMFGSLNAFNEIRNDAILSKNENEIKIFLKHIDDESELLFKYLIYQLITIRDAYPEKIIIEEK